MSDAGTPLEVVVYGDAPDDESGGGGSTDTISIPADFYDFYVPLGPTVVAPPRDLPDGGGGGDIGTADELGTLPRRRPRTSLRALPSLR